MHSPYLPLPVRLLSILFSLLCFANLLPCQSAAQPYDSLTLFKGSRTSVYYSAGADQKARRIAAQLDKVIGFYQEKLSLTPDVTVLLLSPRDWNRYSKDAVYGMPHYTDNKTLIVAAENNPFWNSFIPPLDKLEPAYAQQIREAYSDHRGGLTMEPFFDLLAIHELGHAYHKQGGLQMQRNWMSELFVNIFLHTYIAEEEPELLPALTGFPNMVVAHTDPAGLAYTSLQDLESHYDEIAMKYPQNYGWFQCRWHKAAGTIYDTGGKMIIIKLWSLLKSQKEILNDASFASLLAEKVDQQIADVLLNWDKQLP